MKAIIYIIYLVSKTQERTHGTYKFSFVLYLSLLLLFHIFPLSLILNLIFEEKIEIFSVFKSISNKIVAVIVLIPMILFNYIYFIKMEKLQNIIKKFESNSFVNRYWILIITLYVIFLFILMIVEREYFKAKV